MKKNLLSRCVRLLIASGIFILSFTHDAYSSYMKDVPTEVKQPDGSTLKCFASGSEYHNWLHDKNNYTIIKDKATQFFVYAILVGGKLTASTHIAGKSDPIALGLVKGVNISEEEIKVSTAKMKAARAVPVSANQRMEASAVRPATGVYNNLVIFISFSDQAEMHDSLAAIKAKFNGLGKVSVRDFYKEVSNSQLDLVSTFYPTTTGVYPVSYHDSHPRSYYQKDTPDGYTNTEPDATTREHTLLANAVKAVASQVPASLNIDGDNDGNIDNIVFIINGNTEGWSDLLWPHRWSLFSQTVTINGKRAYDYNNVYSDALGIGVISHELFHSFGAPDLYHYTTYPHDPIGDWDLMASGDWNTPRHMTAYMKQHYANWAASIPVITNPGRYTLQPLSRSPFAAYRINLPNTSQYLVLEYRKKEGRYESAMGGDDGLLIYRINPDASGNGNDGPEELYAFRPNGSNSINGDLAQATFSLNTNRTRFDDFSNPNCFLADGTVGGLGSLGITNLSLAGDVISFDYKVEEVFTPLTQYALNGNANEASGINNGTSSGNTWVAGKFDQAANFDGNDFISLPKTLMNSRTGSVSLWIKTASAAQSMLFYGSSVTAGDGFGSENELHLSLETTGKVKFFIEGGSLDINLLSTGVVNNNAWHHIVATWDINGLAKLYVDNVLSASATHDAKDFNLSGNLYLGRPNASTRYFTGLQDQVILFGQSISAASINSLFNTTTNKAPIVVDDYISGPGFPNNLRIANVFANDSDPDGDKLTLVSVADPINGTINYDGDFSYVSFFPNPDFVGTEIVQYTVSDGKGASTSGFLHFTTTSAKHTPVVTTPIPDQTLVIGASNKTINLNSYFTDADADVLVYSSSSSYAGIAISGSTLTLSPTATGTYNVLIIARDVNNLSVSDVFNLTVTNTVVSSDICVEAETALGQTAFSPYQVYTDASASGGKYISVPNGVGNQSSPPTTSIANLSFNVATAGTYYIWLRVISPTSSDNDVYIRVDNASFSSLTAGPFTTWTWKNWTSKSLTAGAHTISIARKEDGLQIDRIWLSTSSATPTGFGCGSTAMVREGDIEESVLEVSVASLEIAPNPTSGLVRVQLNNTIVKEGTIEIFNSFGTKVAEYENSITEFDASNLSSGVYFVHYNDGSNRLVKTLIVRK